MTQADMSSSPETSTVGVVASSATTPSSINNNNNSSATKTPPRNNYANPHTPIASIKRPRSSLTGGGAKQQRDATLSPMHPVRPVHRHEGEQKNKKKVVPLQDPMILSPTHNEKRSNTDKDSNNNNDNDDLQESAADSSSTSTWVGRKVDALFSPVLRFLDQSEQQTPPDEEPAELAAATTDTETSPASSSGHQSSAADPDDDMDEAVVVVQDLDEEKHATTTHDKEEQHADTASITSSAASDTESLQGQGMPEHDSDEFNPWQFIQSLPPYASVQHLCPPVSLPPKHPAAPAVTLVLDLDETLVHCSVETVENPDLTFPVDFHGATYTVHVKLRPHLFSFLESCRQHFEVVLFTASQKVYANELLNRIDPGMLLYFSVS